ncbi:apolipoprotein N-acyltransferase [Hydrogenophaga sp.]|uniref:apolipoprotein N-acyltransferase n=2 Tax=Hydrogenophaga sp. TaxID=1904254 RepID=UPI002D1FAF30|nr:apolipoprotein N-acyltransferase [Hydrogenophaga sp.]
MKERSDEPVRSLFESLHSPSTFSAMSGRPPRRRPRAGAWLWSLFSLLAGLVHAFSLAWPVAAWSLPGTAAGQPSGIWQLLAMGGLVLAMQWSDRAGQAAWRAGLFATAWLTGTFWWLFISMHTYGGLAPWLAAMAVLALALALSLYYALAACAIWWWAPRPRWLQALLFASLWTLAELARGRWFTGFPWGAAGYAHIDLLGAWAPWVGVYGMGFIAAVLAYGMATGVTVAVRTVTWQLRSHQRSEASRRVRASLLSRLGHGLAALGLWGLLLASLWTGPALLQLGQAGTRDHGTLSVWLLQGNIAQDEKFEPGTGVADALAWYPGQIAEALSRAAAGLPAPMLVVAPETAIPLLPQQLGDTFWNPLLSALARQPDAPQPVGVLLGLPLGSYERGYTNSAWGMDPAAAALALTSAGGPGDLPFFRYDKHHLVPFGEFIPPLFRWFTQLMNIPLGDFDRGPLAQTPWSFAGQRIAPNICYEDLFGEELAAGFLDATQAPTVLVNLSNIGWFGDTVAIDQHLHISRLRAMELGRPMLRATNTGATAVIDHTGGVTHFLPRLTRGRLEAQVQGREGLTPYARWASRWGLWPLWLGCMGVAAAVVLAGRTGSRRHKR